MNWKNIFIIITLAILNFCVLKASNNEFQCRKYNFMTNFNINVEDRIVVLYNAALCSQYLKKLPLLENLHLRFTDANFTNLHFIMLTAPHSENATFTELFQKSGNITIISIQNIQNNIFLPGWMYIFDTCSRLTYELTPQLNGVDMYIKASILSAFYDSICGNCEEYIYEDYDFDGNANPLSNPTNNDAFENDEALLETTSNSEETTQISGSSNFSIPLKIIFPLQPVNKCDNCSFYEHQDYIILSSNDSLFHKHLPSTDVLHLWKSAHNNQNNTFQNNFDASVNANYLTSSEKKVYIKNGSSGVLENNNTIHKSTLLKYTENILLSQDKMAKKSSKYSNISEISSSFHSWLAFHLYKNKTVN